MINLKIDKNNKKEPILKLNYKDLNENKLKFIKRILMESKTIKGSYKYEIPLKYLTVLMNNFQKDEIMIDSSSENFFIEFSDLYDEKYYYTYKITPKYMKKWREEGCSEIYKIEINFEELQFNKKIIFEKISNKIYSK